MGIMTKTLLVAATSCTIVLAAGTAFAISDCLYAGVNFSDGSISCQSGRQFQCSDGDWQSLDLNCEIPASPDTAGSNPALCSCTTKQAADCDANNENCCATLVDGLCTRRCCAR